MKVTFYGHACFGFQLGNSKILVDPFISQNPLAKDIDISKIECDYILLTHGHGDHILDAEAIAKRTGATIIASYEVVNYYAKMDIKGHPMNQGGRVTFPFGAVKCVNAIHSSSFPDGSYAGNPLGFVIESEEKCFYISGDTALTTDMKLIPMICPPIDFSILCIGDNFTMGYHDAILASDFVNCDTIIGCHFDSFDAIKIDKEIVKEAFLKRQKDLILPIIGQEIEF